MICPSVDVKWSVNLYCTLFLFWLTLDVVNRPANKGHGLRSAKKWTDAYVIHLLCQAKKWMDTYIIHLLSQAKKWTDTYVIHLLSHAKKWMDTYIIHLPSQANCMDTYIIHQPSQRMNGYLSHPSTKPPNRLKIFAWKARRVLSFEPTTGVGNEVGG